MRQTDNVTLSPAGEVVNRDALLPRLLRDADNALRLAALDVSPKLMRMRLAVAAAGNRAKCWVFLPRGNLQDTGSRQGRGVPR
jgi:hypothetical protein